MSMCYNLGTNYKLFKLLYMAKKNVKIGLALGSGAFRGMAHIGVLKVLERNNIKVDYLSGSSIGGLVAAYYSIFANATDLEKELESWPMDNLYKFLDLSWNGGFIAGNKLSKFLQKKFGETTLEQTKIPVKILSTNLIDGSEIVFDSGKITDAVRATISVPLMFKPYKFEDKLLVDGAISSPVPIKILKEMGANFTIGINLYHKNEFKKSKFTVTKIAMRSTRIALYNLAKNDVMAADISICPDTSDIISNEVVTSYDMNMVRKIIKIGEKAAEEAIPEIKKALGRK